MPSVFQRIIRRYVLPPVARAAGRSFLEAAHDQLGIGHASCGAGGEDAFLRHILTPLLRRRTSAVTVFDIGANIGNYTMRLLEAVPGASIYSFEPAPGACTALQQRIQSARVSCVPLGLSDEPGTAAIFDYRGRPSSGHASIHKEVFSTIHRATALRSTNIRLTTIDMFCAERGLERVDFAKVDTEGNELAVLRGAKHLIASGGFPLVQFEFNSMNVVSRSFLKDFYEILPGYRLYRLLPSKLLHLGDYNVRNEIFDFQNIVAAHPDAGVEAFRSHIVRAR